MKAKRFLGILLSALLIVSCFALPASAAGVLYEGETLTLNIHLNDNGTAQTAAAQGKAGDDVTGIAATEEAKTELDGANPVEGAKFEIKDSTGTKVGEITTGADGVAKFTTTTKGRYTVNQTALGKFQTVAVAEFKVDLPMTNPTDDSLLMTVDVYPKVPVNKTVPTITKKVSDHDGDYGQSASIRSYTNNDAYWMITVKTPNEIELYKALTVTDVLDERLAAGFSIDGLTVVNGGASAFADGDFTKTYTAAERKIVVDFTASGIAKLEEGKDITIKFTTKIDLSKPNTIATKIGNHTTLNYTNKTDVSGITDNTPGRDEPNPGDPNKDPSTPEPDWPINPGDDDDVTGTGTDDPYVWTGKLDFVKIAKGDTSKPLTATFQLYTKDGTAVGNAFTTNTDGTFSIKGLNIGEYYLLETKAPQGYELIGEKIPFKITGLSDAVVTFDPENSVENATKISFSVSGTNYIVNIPSSDLPLTGGMGTGAFALLGAVLAAAGAIALIKTRKVGAR